MKLHSVLRGMACALLVCAGAGRGQLAAEEWGLVLAGGGAKGAYQVGVWKALSEYGIAQKVTVISGTSVGGLNAALFASVSPAEAERIWLEQVPSRLTQDGKLISQAGLSAIIDSVPLDTLKAKSSPHVVVTAVRNSMTALKYIDATMLGAGAGSHARRFLLNGSTRKGKTSALLATSAVPLICEPVWIGEPGGGGHWYSDGGQENVGGDNVPLEPVASWYPAVEHVIVVYCSDRDHVGRRVRAKDYDRRLSLMELFPSIDLDGDGFWEGLRDGMANFSRERIQLLIQTGYDDTVTVLRQRGLYPLSSYWYQ